ncbi:MAG: class I SAM-dependent methyltransferase [Candidatus Saccharimonadales bacterium]
MIGRAVAEQVLSRLKVGSLVVNYWDKQTKTYGRGEPRVALKINDPKVLSDIIRRQDLGFGEAYMAGRLEIASRDLLKLFELADRNSQIAASSSLPKIPYRRQSNTKNRQARQIASHYDLGNDFYKLWLDQTMTYTCAYFHSPKDSLEAAQRQKIDHVLRKLQLQPGHEFVDIGCGWGYLVVRAAKLYGAKGLGVTLSREQYKFAKDLAGREGVAHLAKFKNSNYQDLLPSQKRYDRVVSVGILEHIGRGQHAQYFKVVDGLLKPGGISLAHSITHQTETKISPWLDKYIFPGGYIPSLRELISLLPNYNFRVIDVENLRPHYALTLRAWLKRFEQNAPEIAKMYDENFVRMWRLYLAGSISSFETAGNDLSQIVFSKGINNDLPLTRKFLYR